MNQAIQLWLPLAILRKFGTIYGITRLQKLVFLAEVEGHVGNVMGFTKYKYGPYSQVLQSKVQNYTEFGFLECNEEEMPEGYENRKDHCLTEAGKKFLENLENQWRDLVQLNEKLDILEDYEDMTTANLRRYVYSKYLTDDGVEVFQNKLMFTQSELESYKETWKTFELEHYPLSYFVLAVLEHMEEILGKIENTDATLENTIIVSSIRYLLTQVWNLLDALETSKEPIPSQDQSVIYAQDELDDIIKFLDQIVPESGLGVAFSDLTIDSLTPNP